MELLEKLTQCNSPSGRESKICELIKNEISNLADKTYTDSLGNLIAVKNGTDKKIAVMAHMDEIGIVVTFIDEKGFIRFAQVGGLSTRELIGRRVVFDNGIVGVIGIHSNVEKITVKDLYIDVCNDTKQIQVGDMAVFCGEYVETDDAVISKALDNRVGCFVAIEAFKRLVESKNDLYFIFSVQEEVGLRGAKTAIFNINPDYALAIDVTDTGDTPKAVPMAVKLGGGAAIKVMDNSIICHSKVREMLINLADKNNIPYQLEVMTDGGTDAGAIHLSGAGVKTGGISIPTRYVHSPSEMACKNDIDACINLLTEFLK